ncbi:MAG: hypothetical protein KBS59_03520 [Clostridiales bacterium]|nr:hypothetical protein [Clostridiales bacterium]
MKTAKLISRAAALILVIAMAVCVLASCESAPVMTLTADGKTYTISAAEYTTFMKIIKMNFYLNNGYSSIYDSFLWSVGSGNNQTYDEYYCEYVENLMKSTVVEKYLADKNGLKISDTSLAGYKENIKQLNSYYGGMGAYKQYFGYTANQYFDFYQKATDMSQLLVDYYFKGENAVSPVTDEQIDEYYNSDYSGFMYIYLDMNNKLKRDDEGHYFGTDASGKEYTLSITNDNGTVTIENLGVTEGTPTDISTVEIVALSTTALTEEEIEEKSSLPALIIDELKNNPDADFKTLALEYSDDYYSYYFENGVFISSTGYIVNNETIMNAARALEVGENTEALEVSDGKYVYIIKKIELLDKAYDTEEYAELFESFEETVMYEKYEELINSYFDQIVVDKDTISKYTMADTFLTPYVDSYADYLQSITG